jgi:sugar O-acyltransferase (sialic acid O-acetyltransferase NeuD family)
MNSNGAEAAAFQGLSGSGPRHALQVPVRGERIVIVGTGEQAELAFEYFTYDSPHEVVAFSAEPQFIESAAFCGLPVVSLDDLPAAYPPAAYHAFVAISGTQLNRLRRRLYDVVKAAGYTCVSYVSSRAFVWPNVEIGENTFIFENNVLQHKVRVGDNVVLWSGNHVGHRTVIEDDCFITSHVVISGFCRVGRCSYLGVNSSVRDELSIAEDCVIGAGAVMVKDADARQVYVGNPAHATGRDSFSVFKVPVA